MKKWESKAQTYFEWLAENLTKGGQKVGLDATQIGAAGFRNRSKYFTEKNIEMKAIDQNLVDEVWGAEKPAIPSEKVFIHEVKYSGESVQQKYDKVAAKLDKKVDVLLVSTLDDIDWLVNLRGNDIAFNPVFISYLLFFPAHQGTEHSARLFIDPSKVSDEAVKKHLAENRIEAFGYDEIWAHLK